MNLDSPFKTAFQPIVSRLGTQPQPPLHAQHPPLAADRELPGREAPGSAPREARSPALSALYAQESVYQGSLQNGVLKKYPPLTQTAVRIEGAQLRPGRE